MERTKAPPSGLKWNPFRKWYSENIGTAPQAVVSKAYADYVEQKGETRAISPKRGTSPSKRTSPKRTSPKRASPRRATSPPRISPSKRVSPKRVSPRREAQLRRSFGLCKELEPYSNTTYDMSMLICTQLAKGHVQWSEILDVLKCQKPPCNSCTKIGYKVAKSLIKVAATRVFADPEQSIVEPIVNSFDAYSSIDPNARGRRVGKFGMGAFSFLYWLIGHPTRTVTIETVYEDGLRDYCSYTVTIREVGDSLMFTLIIKPINQRTKTTTRFDITLDASEDKFTNDNLDGFSNQVVKTLYLTGAELNVNILESGATTTLTNDFNSNKTVTVEISKTRLRVRDEATGVSLDILLGSFFTPSISTKTLRLERVIDEKLNSRIELGRNLKRIRTHNLNILVGNVVIVTFSTTANGIHDYLLELPSNTRVPVSRDDIILTEQTKRYLIEGINKLFEAAVERFRDVSALQDLLEQYIEYTSNPDTRNVIRGALNEYYIKNRDKLVPIHEAIYFRWPSLVLSKTYDVEYIEKWLYTNAKPQTNIWYGINVIVLDRLASNVSNGSLTSYLFISEEYITKLGKEWIRTIASSYHNTKLYPYISNYGKEAFIKYNQPIATLPKIDNEYPRPSLVLSDDAVQLLFSVLLKVDSLNSYFALDSIDIARRLLTEQLVEVYMFIPELYRDICNALLRKMNTFVGNQTYGGERYRLIVIETNIETEVMTTIPRDKMLSFLRTHISVVIDTTKEETDTMLMLTNVNSPRGIHKALGEEIAGRYFLEEAMKQCNTFVEFTFLSASVGKVLYDNKKVHIAALPGFVSYMLDRIRARKPTELTLKHAYDTWGNQPLHITAVSLQDTIRDILFVREWNTSVRNLERIQLEPSNTVIEEMKNEKDKIRLSSMMSYLFSNEVPDKLEEFLSNVKEAKLPSTPLQAIEIAINEGTTKPFLEAVLTELTQNSLDAIREFKPSNDAIEIWITRSEDMKTAFLHIEDYVGMSEEAFLYIGIPFLSTKTPSEMVTGEIGSGFFNVYRESEYVVVDSTKDNVRRLMVDVPIREGDRVVDLDKTYRIEAVESVEIEKKKGKIGKIGQKIGKAKKKGKPGVIGGNKTTITIAIPTLDELTYINIATRVEYTARYILGTIPHQHLRYADTFVNIERILVYKIGNFEVYKSGTRFSYDSYLTTKGIPFQPLEPFADKVLPNVANLLITHNYIINITHGGYVPVQTRTKIRLEPKSKQEFDTAIVYAMFVALLADIIEKNRVWPLDHYDSTSDVRQLQFTELAPFDVTTTNVKSLQARYILKYTKFFEWPTLAALINECIKVMDIRTYEESKDDIFKVLQKYKSPYGIVDSLIIGTVVGWFKRKNRDIKKTTTVVAAGEAGIEKKEVIIGDAIFQPIIETWVNVWWNLARQGKVRGYSRPVPKAFAVRSNKPASGWYNPNNHEMYINVDYITKDDAVAIIRSLRSKNLDALQSQLPKIKGWISFFGYGYPSATLIHELEHARRGSSHDAAGHDSLVISLWPNDPIDTYTFDQCANRIYEHVLELGFYSMLLSKM